MSRPELLLAYCHPGSVRHEFMESVLQLLSSERKFELAITSAYSGPLLSKTRNLLAERFLEHPNFTHLLMADTDMQFTPQDVQSLLDADKPIVGALYYGLDNTTHEPFPTALVFEGGHYKPMKKAPNRGCKRVDAVGMGLTLIKREVIEALEPDHTQLWPFAEAVLSGIAVGEDVTFCLRAREKGFDTWVCGDARAGHVKSFPV